MGTIDISIEQMVHNPINGTQADIEWGMLVPKENSGLVLLGPDSRRFGISMIHSLHCLDRLRKAIKAKPTSPSGQYHIQHCFNYIRQMVLCAADTRLDPFSGVSREETPVSDRRMSQYTCRDWLAVYQAMNNP
ncbi:hypothetical protein BJ138DRAFT_1143692 [Hygrophoropsis aurantiaca]|uniref:Uncharacterized protein n=1 Tax=Hygrophoropsis aurantiaca TaxID=72124 RepID=A0ACB8ANF2_9AGAM|nr:hypothetical protein BJ138DRAFT_1143692 [Hygrophoropsis aurantiaca]